MMFLCLMKFFSEDWLKVQRDTDLWYFNVAFIIKFPFNIGTSHAGFFAGTYEKIMVW